MRAAPFLGTFDQLVDTSASIARIRRLILDLAVQGKLVTQDANDEPAHDLLKRIQAEKLRLARAGEIKHQEPLPAVAEDAISFQLPAGWAPTQLGDIAI